MEPSFSILNLIRSPSVSRKDTASGGGAVCLPDRFRKRFKIAFAVAVAGLGTVVLRAGSQDPPGVPLSEIVTESS